MGTPNRVKSTKHWQFLSCYYKKDKRKGSKDSIKINDVVILINCLSTSKFQFIEAT